MPTRYRSSDEDSARWDGFEFRAGDIVISTRSKSGTTWMQMICALLIFGRPDLPAPLSELSPWLDWLMIDRDQIHRRLAAQPHRRFIKTHTPLDGIPLDPRVSYIVVARDPLDMAVSLYHQGANLDRDRMRALTGAPAPTTPAAPRRPIADWLRLWIDSRRAPADALDDLPGVMWHLSDAWARRDQPNILLAHYDDLRADLEGQMRGIAAWLDIEVSEDRWPLLVEAATFERMRARAGELVPDPVGIMKDRAVFFRQGRSGAGQALLDPEDLIRYDRRVAQLAPADLLAWLHRDRSPAQPA